MATNEERQEAAKRLRSLAYSDLIGNSLLRSLKEVTGEEDGSWRDVLKRLADLIEPEPMTLDQIPMVRAVRPDGSVMFRGWYARLHRTTYAFSDDGEPEELEIVVHEEMTDWGLPNKWLITGVTPPERIEVIPDGE